jgi:hypothetical protein
MFKPKYTITLINSKWEVIERNANISLLPRSGEYLFHNKQYYEVINVVHMLNKVQDIFVIIEPLSVNFSLNVGEIKIIEK